MTESFQMLSLKTSTANSALNCQYQGASAISVASGKESFMLYPRMFSTLYPPASQVTAYPGKREGRTTRSTIDPFKKHSRHMLEVL